MVECFHLRFHYTCRIAYFFRTLHEHTLACDVILVARQRISTFTLLQEQAQLMRCLATKITSHAKEF